MPDRQLARPAIEVAACPPHLPPPPTLEGLAAEQIILHRSLRRVRRNQRAQGAQLKDVHDWVVAQKQRGGWWRKMMDDALYHAGKTLIQFALVAVVSAVTMALASPNAWREMSERFWHVAH